MVDESRYPHQNPLPDISLSPLLAGKETPVIHALLCSTDHAVLMTDHLGNDILCNPQFGEMFDVDPEFVVRSDRADVRRLALSRVQDPAAFLTMLERAYADSTLEAVDEITLRGEPIRTIRRYTAPVCDAEGTSIGRVWTFQDITETRRLEAAVDGYAREVDRHLHEQVSALWATTEVLETISGISRVIASRDDLWPMLDKLAALLAGILGYNRVMLLVPDGVGVLAGPKCDAHGIPARVELQIASVPVLATTMDRALGRPRTIFKHRATGTLSAEMGKGSIVLGPLRWNAMCMGVLVLGGRAVPIDDSRRPHLEAVITQTALALRIYVGRVELEAAYETLKTAQEQVVQSAKLAAVGTLAASIAHDIRNIMTPLRLDLEVAPDTPDLMRARAQVDRLSALTHRLLALARPGHIDRSAIDIADIVQRAVKLIEPQAEVDGIKVTVRFAAKLPSITGDSTRLEHLFINLMLNALDAMHSRGGRLRIVVGARSGGLSVAVSDTGPGIAPEIVERMFEPFFTTRANGSGLGLFSARRILEENGGSMRVSSVPTGGARFEVWLPCSS